MNTIDSSAHATSQFITTSGSEPQGPVPAPCPEGHSPARPSSSAVECEDAEADRGPRYIRATYDCADDKIRIRASSRVDSETYHQLKAAGFSWAPKQSLFYAVWSPEREDVATWLAGELDEEDTTLAERAEVRAGRFDGYQDRRAVEAEGARQAVARIADGIPLGQSILVGHHSERRARRDAKRIENGIRKAIDLFETSEYWERRARAALRHAAYVERSGVRARRIKKLEAEGRGWQRKREDAARALKVWRSLHLDESLTRRDGEPSTFLQRALYVSGRGLAPSGIWSDLRDGKLTPETAQGQCIELYEGIVPVCDRWGVHIHNRLIYERMMLEADGGLAGARFDYQVGGKVQRGGKWFTIRKVNRAGGALSSVSVSGHFASVITLDEITGYEPPSEGAAEKVKAANDRGPMCNYPGAGFAHTTAAEWKALPRWSGDRYTQNHPETETHGRHRTKCRPTKNFSIECVYITNARRVDPPLRAAGAAPAPQPEPPETDIVTLSAETAHLERAQDARAARDAKATPFREMAAGLKAGVAVVAAPQLFPTPPLLAARMVMAARLEPGLCVLEPNGGTGSLIQAVIDRVDTEVLTYEINRDLCSALERRFPSHKVQVRCRDFLEVSDFQGSYPRILMNPPFANGQDIAHIRHALTFLAPGGVLVGLCADGARQREQLRPQIEAAGGTWESIPDSGFAGTSVQVALLTVRAPTSFGT